MEIAIVGGGHVGLISGACLALIGHRVRVLDVDAQRVEGLNRGISPFFEPGLDELLDHLRGSETISFHTDADAALAAAELVFLCVGTPNRPDGQVDLSAVVAGAQATAEHAPDGALVVNRSTVPVGTAAFIRSMLEDTRGDALGVAVNPEFLAEGRAVRDFLDPDRLVIGAWSDDDREILVKAYEPIISRGLPPGAPESVPADADPVPVVKTSPHTAELIKYAANAFLAVKISFINEIAGIAEELGGDVTEIAEGVGLDRRIGPHFLRAGIGWGGSCFPKDIVALQGMAQTRGLDARIVRAANEVNTDQHRWVIRKLQLHMKTLVGRRVTLLGLAFKAHTDDLRNAPAVELARDLVRLNVRVRGFDPAVRELPEDLRETIELAGDPIAATEGAEALVLVTEWPEFAELDLAELKSVMRTPLLLDGRNFFDPDTARAAGFTYEGVGRQ